MYKSFLLIVLLTEIITSLFGNRGDLHFKIGWLVRNKLTDFIAVCFGYRMCQARQASAMGLFSH
jgi:hypothetical protein